MKKQFRLILGALAFLVAGTALADNKVIEEALKALSPNLKPESIEKSPVPGLYEVTVGPRIYYISEDGKYLIQGSLVDLKAREDVTEKKQGAARIAALNKVGTSKMVVFKPKLTKYVVYIFTDIDCGYCRKLHSEIDSYLKNGIEIRYLFFPRAGENTESFFKAVSVWCAKDRNAALTKAKKGEGLEKKQCDNPVKAHMDLGAAMGANGTPMIVTEKGTVIPGYVPADQLYKMLEEESAPAKKP